MSERPWLTLVGIGENGASGLSAESRHALARAEVVMAPPRHLSLLGRAQTQATQTIEWPTPFADGIPALLALRGRSVVVLASGCPFWFGAGTVLAEHLKPEEWCCHPAPSTFSLAASRLGWSLQETPCLGLHASSLARLRPHATVGRRALVLLRGPSAANELLCWLRTAGFHLSQVTFLEALGGPRERIRSLTADAVAPNDLSAPLAAAIQFEGTGPGLPLATGIPDPFFEHDGQITKSPMRALTLSALAPLPGEHLWDLGAGAGSIAIEWLLQDPSLSASAVERDLARSVRISENAARLGVDRLNVVHGQSLDCLPTLRRPDAVFIGGGASDSLIEAVLAVLRPGARLVVNAVTLETQALVQSWRRRVGGELLRVAFSRPSAVGSHEVWRDTFPVLQWLTHP